MSFNNQLQRELTLWLKEGLITQETADTLYQRYPVTKRSMTQTLALLGSILVGIGVILFFAANWEVMPRWMKIAVVILSFTLSYLSGHYLTHIRRDFPKVGYALICLGSILYGSAIWLIAQIFHLQAEAGMGFMLWYLGVIPIAYLYGSSLNLFLALATLTAWFLAGNYPLGPAFVVFPILLGGTILPLAIRKKDLFNFVAAVVAVYLWFIALGTKLSAADFSLHLGIVSLFILSIVLYLSVHLWDQKKPFFAGNFLLSISFIGIYAALGAFSFNAFLQEFYLYRKFELLNFPYLIAGAILIMAVLKLKERKVSLKDLPLFLLYLLVFPFFPELGKNLPLLIFNNVVFFIFAILAIYYGYLIKSPFIFNLSMVLFAGAIAMKYFDFFFELLPKSAFFIAGGMLLLLGSLILENKRRSLINSMGRGDGLAG
ncbi:MAG: DUF2157 domain-containing protein [Bacillota bacterium]